MKRKQNKKNDWRRLFFRRYIHYDLDTFNSRRSYHRGGILMIVWWRGRSRDRWQNKHSRRLRGSYFLWCCCCVLFRIERRWYERRWSVMPRFERRRWSRRRWSPINTLHLCDVALIGGWRWTSRQIKRQTRYNDSWLVHLFFTWFPVSCSSSCVIADVG